MYNRTPDTSIFNEFVCASVLFSRLAKIKAKSKTFSLYTPN